MRRKRAAIIAVAVAGSLLFAGSGYLAVSRDSAPIREIPITDGKPAPVEFTFPGDVDPKKVTLRTAGGEAIAFTGQPVLGVDTLTMTPPYLPTGRYELRWPGGSRDLTVYSEELEGTSEQLQVQAGKISDLRTVEKRLGACELTAGSKEQMYCAASALLSLRPEDQRKGIEKFDTPDTRWFAENCHSIAHILGRSAWKSYIVDPAQAFSARCGFGFLHGVLQSVAIHVPDSWFDEHAGGFCQPVTDKPGRETCTHGLGHAFVKRANNNIERIAKWCQAAATTTRELSSCADGVFMEYLNMRVNQLGSWPKAGVDTLQHVCPAATGSFRTACFMRASSYIDPVDTSALASATCSSDAADLASCALGVGTRHSDESPTEALALCRTLYQASTTLLACLSGWAYPRSMGGFGDDTITASCEPFPEPYRSACRRYFDLARLGANTFVGGAHFELT